MFSGLEKEDRGECSTDTRNDPEELRSFLGSDENIGVDRRALTRETGNNARPWKLSTAILAFFLLISLASQARKGMIVSSSYESGFDTDLQPAISSIRTQRQRFYGGIIVNSSSQFELVLHPDSPRYTGHPTQELDDAWDRIVGGYLALTEAEANEVQGSVSVENGKYYVVPHVRHSLHCVNYLRKVAYDKWYPTIRTENKPTVPTFFMHVDHCIETLRETLQCQADMTPVPHIWSQEKQMYLADTTLDHTCRDFDAIAKWQDDRTEAWKANGM